MGGYRRGYEFPKQTRYEAIDRADYTCERCGSHHPGGKGLEAHHQIPIWWAIRHKEFAPALIKSIANLEVLCRECHFEADEELYQMTDEEIRGMAMTIFGLFQLTIKWKTYDSSRITSRFFRR